MRYFKFSNMPAMKGQSLIEVLVSLGIIAIVVTAITTIITASLNNAQFVKDQSTANGYAQEGAEIVRGIRDADYSGFGTYSGNYCLDRGNNTLTPAPSGCTTPNVDKFIRSVQIEQNPGCGANVAKTTVDVSWSDGKCPTDNLYCHKASLVSCLSTVNPVVAP